MHAPLGSCAFPSVALMVTFQLQETWVLASSPEASPLSPVTVKVPEHSMAFTLGNLGPKFRRD